MSDNEDAIFANDCREAADSIDRMFQAGAHKMARPVDETAAPNAYEACIRWVDTAYWERHGLTAPPRSQLARLAQRLRDGSDT